METATLGIEPNTDPQVLPQPAALEAREPSREEAVRLGLKHYYSSEPCSLGHVGKRRLANNECCECSKQRSAKWRSANPSAAEAVRSDYERRNPDRHKAYKELNADLIKNRQAVYFQRNKDRIINNKRQRRASSQERYNDEQRRYYANNKDKKLLRDRVYRSANREKLRAKRRKYVDDNRLMFYVYTAARRAAEARAMPKWADRDKIREFYERAVDMTIQSGIKHHVDHIVPLRGKEVCGLHVHYNLQVITWLDNLSKGNKYHDV